MEERKMQEAKPVQTMMHLCEDVVSSGKGVARPRTDLDLLKMAGKAVR